MTDRDDRLAELQQLKGKVKALEEELQRAEGDAPDWAPKHYYATYHLLAGMVLGLIGAASSLLFNVVGAAMAGKHPLELIRVYLTFPLGEKALTQESGFILAAGCCLYLGTGMFGGIPFHLILSRYFNEATIPVRFLAVTGLAVGVWLVNYYGIIYWLQPAMIGGDWIIENIPIWVAVLTHLVFGWTMLLVDQWGRFVPPVQGRRELSR